MNPGHLPCSSHVAQAVADWPHRPQADRFLRLAFPYDSMYRNEGGQLKALSASSGLGALSYLPEHRKHVTEQADELLSFLIDMPVNPIPHPDRSLPSSPLPSPPIDESLWAIVIEEVAPINV
jgi:hypothetical protein